MLLPQNCIKYDRTSIKALNQCGFFHNHCKIKLTIIQGMVIFYTINIFVYFFIKKNQTLGPL